VPDPNWPPKPNRDRKGADRAARDATAPNRDRKGADATAPAEPLPHGRGSDTSAGPLAYFLTFHTYGTWLHGDDRGSVDREHNQPGTPCLPPNEQRRRRAAGALQHAPLTLGEGARALVERTVLEVAEYRGWTVHTLAVRSNHVHVIVSAPERPEPVMNAFKSWSTRRLVEAGLLPPHTRAWVRHGSTGYLWKPVELRAACKYVAYGQGADQ
jgi:REP element-mobilizing transposase RayT